MFLLIFYKSKVCHSLTDLQVREAVQSMESTAFLAPRVRLWHTRSDDFFMVLMSDALLK